MTKIQASRPADTLVCVCVCGVDLYRMRLHRIRWRNLFQCTGSRRRRWWREIERGNWRGRMGATWSMSSSVQSSNSVCSHPVPHNTHRMLSQGTIDHGKFQVYAPIDQETKKMKEEIFVYIISNWQKRKLNYKHNRNGLLQIITDVEFNRHAGSHTGRRIILIYTYTGTTL